MPRRGGMESGFVLNRMQPGVEQVVPIRGSQTARCALSSVSRVISTLSAYIVTVTSGMESRPM